MENEQVVVEETTSTKEVAPEVETPKEETQEVPEVKDEEVVIPPPKKQTAQERINAVIRKQREAEREAEHWKRLAEQKEQVAQTSTRPQMPQIENFTTQDDYNKALQTYEDAVYTWRRSAEQQQYQQQMEKVAETQAVSNFRQKAEKLREIYEDFDEVVEQPVFSPTMREVLLNSDEGAMVAYFLGREENRQVADKINSLPVKLQVYELGKLEERLKLAKKTQKPTGAPSPISPVGATGGKKIDDSNLTDQEWFEIRKQEKIRKLKAKSGG